jgi:hypothetical protein
MWQVVSGTANLLSDCGLQAVVQTVAGDGKPYLLHTGRAFMLLGAPSSAGDTHPLIILLGLLSGGCRTSSGFEMPAWTAAARPPSAVIFPGFRLPAFDRRVLPQGPQASRQRRLDAGQPQPGERANSADQRQQIWCPLLRVCLVCIWFTGPQREADTNPMPLTW